MVQEHLLNFIKKNLNEGYDKSRLTEVLLKNGYDPAIIDEAFVQVEGGSPVEVQQQAPVEAQTTPVELQPSSVDMQSASVSDQSQQPDQQQAPVESQPSSAVHASQEPTAQDSQPAQQNVVAEDKPKKNLFKIILFALLGVVIVAVLILLVIWMIPSDDDSTTTVTPPITQNKSDVNLNVTSKDNDTLRLNSKSVLTCRDLDITKNISRFEEVSMSCFFNLVKSCNNSVYTIIDSDNTIYTLIHSGKLDDGACVVEIESRTCVMDDINVSLSGNEKVDEHREEITKNRIISSCKINDYDTINACLISDLLNDSMSNTTTSLNQNSTLNLQIIKGLISLESKEYEGYFIDCS